MATRYALPMDKKSLSNAVWVAINGGDEALNILRNLSGDPAAQAFGCWLTGDIDSSQIPETNRQFLLDTARRAVSAYWFRSDLYLFRKFSAFIDKTGGHYGGVTIPAGALSRSRRIGQLALKLTDPAPSFTTEDFPETKEFHYMYAWLYDVDTRRLLRDPTKPLPKSSANPYVLRYSLQCCIDYGWHAMIFPGISSPEKRRLLPIFLSRLANWLKDGKTGEIDLHHLELDFIGEADLRHLAELGYTQAAYELGKSGKPCPTVELRESWASGVEYYAGRLFKIPVAHRLTVSRIAAAAELYPWPLLRAAAHYFCQERVLMMEEGKLFADGEEFDNSALDNIKEGAAGRKNMTYLEAVEFIQSQWNDPSARYSV